MNGRLDASLGIQHLGHRVAKLRRGAILLCAVAVACVFACGSALGAVTLFSETFEGYSSFPSQIPSGDFVNEGLPNQSEGSDEYWYGGRFQSGTGTIDQDLFVQKIGGGSNNSHVGRFEDDAGIFFHISTLGYSDATLDFDWRTFQAETPDKFTAGYYTGSLSFSGDYYDFNVNAPHWSSWTQLLSGNASDSWHHASYALPGGVADLWVAFWLNDGEGDYGKIDNVLVMGTQSVPEPSSLLIAAIGGVACCGVVVRRRRLGKLGRAAR